MNAALGGAGTEVPAYVGAGAIAGAEVPAYDCGPSRRARRRENYFASSCSIVAVDGCRVFCRPAATFSA